MLTTDRQPGFIKFVVFFKSLGLIPLAFIYRYWNAALNADSAIGKMVRRIGENHIELEFEGIQKLDTISVKESEVLVL